jgi:hypothetical protein
LAGRSRIAHFLAWSLPIVLILTPLGQSPALADSPIDTPAGSGLFSTLATVDSDPARANTSFPVSGTLADRDGSPIRNADLAVYLDPGPAMLQGSSATPGVRLAATRTNANGDFRLKVPALRDIGAYLDDKGRVTLQFMRFGDQHSMLYQQKVKLPTAAGQPALAAVNDSRVFTSASRATTTPALAGMRLTVSGGSAKTTSQSAGGIGTLAMNEPSECTRAWSPYPWGNYWWVREGDPIKTWVPVQRAQTGNRTRLTYDWSNSEQTSTEVGVKYEYKEVAASGGFTNLTTAAGGANFTADPNTVRDLEVEYDFYNFRLWCSISGDVTNRRDARVTKALPVRFTIGNRKTRYSGYYTCLNDQYRAEISDPAWVSRSSTTTLYGSASVYGLSLGATQVNTESHKKTYIPVTTPAYLCGQDAVPALTEKVGETSAGPGGPCPCPGPTPPPGSGGGGSTPPATPPPAPAVAIYNNEFHVASVAPNGNVIHTWFDGLWHTANLGGVLQGTPSIAVYGNEFHIVASNGTTVFQKWFSGTTWYDWAPISTGKNPATAVYHHNGLTEFHVTSVATNGNVIHTWYDGLWHTENRGGTIQGTPTIAIYGNEFHIVASNGTTVQQKWFSGTTWYDWAPISTGYNPVANVYSRNGLSEFHVTSREPDGAITDAWYDGLWHNQTV